MNTVILGVENGGVGQKILILAQILRGAWPKTSKIHILTFFDIKSIIFELRSKLVGLKKSIFKPPEGFWEISRFFPIESYIKKRRR